MSLRPLRENTARALLGFALLTWIGSGRVQGQVTPAGTQFPGQVRMFPSHTISDLPSVSGHPAGPPAASLIVPGVGQLSMGQRRGWAYLTVEIAVWALYLDRRSSARDLRRQYQDLAWEVARSGMGTRVEGDFEYYETLGGWLRSGEYDRRPNEPGLHPETDVSSYNGSIWDRARRIFGASESTPDPDRPSDAAALDFYREHAAGPEFLWDWTGRLGARDEFLGLVEQSDERFRVTTILLGVVMANHVISAVDALVGARALHVAVVPEHGQLDRRWRLTVSIGGVP